MAPILGGIVKVGLHDGLKEIGDVVVVEGREAAEENVGDDSNAPHVDLTAITARQEDLGGCTPNTASAKTKEKGKEKSEREE